MYGVKGIESFWSMLMGTFHKLTRVIDLLAMPLEVMGTIRQAPSDLPHQTEWIRGRDHDPRAMQGIKTKLVPIRHLLGRESVG